MLNKIITFFKSPLGKRVMIWGIPVVLSFISKRLGKKQSTTKSSKRR